MDNKELSKVLGIEKDNATDEEIANLIGSLKSDKARLSAEIDNHKALISKRNSEIAELKKKATETLTDDEKHKQYVAELEEKVKKLERDSKISEIKAKYLASGYDTDEAEKCSKACAENNFDLLVKYQSEHQAKEIEKVKANLLKQTPNPQGGSGTPANAKFTKENFKKGILSMEELSNLQKENPTLFDEITK